MADIMGYKETRTRKGWIVVSEVEWSRRGKL